MKGKPPVEEFLTNENENNVSDSFAIQTKEAFLGRMSSTVVMLEISKTKIEKIYSIKETYVILKHLVGCC
jgi:hypothetical protein